MSKDTFPFELGSVVTTPRILELIENNPYNLIEFIHRHRYGDWGDVCEEDKQANDYALKHGGRLVSSYMYKETKIWIITEADRNLTTVLLPEEY